MKPSFNRILIFFYPQNCHGLEVWQYPSITKISSAKGKPERLNGDLFVWPKWYNVNSPNPPQVYVVKKPCTYKGGDGSVQIQGGTALKCWEEVMNLAKELAVDAVDRVLAIFWPMILRSRLLTMRKLDTRATFGLFFWLGTSHPKAIMSACEGSRHWGY